MAVGWTLNLLPPMAPRFPWCLAKASSAHETDQPACSSPAPRRQACRRRRLPLHAPSVAAPDSYVDLDPQLIARDYRAPELGSLNSGEQHQLALAVFHFG